MGKYVSFYTHKTYFLFLWESTYNYNSNSCIYTRTSMSEDLLIYLTTYLLRKNSFYISHIIILGKLNRWIKCNFANSNLIFIDVRCCCFRFRRCLLGCTSIRRFRVKFLEIFLASSFSRVGKRRPAYPKPVGRRCRLLASSPYFERRRRHPSCKNLTRTVFRRVTVTAVAAVIVPCRYRSRFAVHCYHCFYCCCTLIAACERRTNHADRTVCSVSPT